MKCIQLTVIDFLTPSGIVVLGNNIVVIEDTKAILFEFTESTLNCMNDFQINTLPSSSFVETKTVFSALSKPVHISSGLFFVGGTNKGELLSFKFANGKFIISPMTAVNSDTASKNIFTVLQYDHAHGCLLAIGESSDGALMRVAEDFKSVEVIRAIPNWAPIVDINSIPKKNGLVLATSGNSRLLGHISQVRHGIRNSIIMQSDPHFRGASRLWPLKRFKSDHFHSFVAVSFATSTSLFSIKGTELEHVQAHGLETALPTITISNLDTTSFWLQVCPDRVLAVKISGPDSVNPPTASLWKPDGLLVVAAAILQNYVIVFDRNCQAIRVLHAACNIASGSSEITEIGHIAMECNIGSALTAFPLRLGTDSEFILAASNEAHLCLWKVTSRNGLVLEHLAELNLTTPVNSLAFWKNRDRIFLAAGFSDGNAAFYHLDGTFLHNILTAQIGNAPVRLVVVKQEHGNQSLCCTSRGVWFIAHGEGQELHPEKFHPHVDCFAEIYLSDNTKQRTFITTKKDTVAIIEADLQPSAWLYRMFSAPDLRRVMIAAEGTTLISSVSSLDSSQGHNTLELLHMSELESVLRTKIPAHITTICPLTRDGYFAVTSLDPSGQGSVHIYSSLGYQDVGEKGQRRRASVADMKRQPASFSFVAASSGFYCGISSMCEVFDG